MTFNITGGQDNDDSVGLFDIHPKHSLYEHVAHLNYTEGDVDDLIAICMQNKEAVYQMPANEARHMLFVLLRATTWYSNRAKFSVD